MMQATAHLSADVDAGHYVFIIKGFPDNKPAGYRLVMMRRQ
jgi:hypothetical protein